MSGSRDGAATLQTVIDIATQAGAILLEGWQTRPAVVSKSAPIDLVTAYDGRAEAAIVTALRAAFPDDGIVGEEGSRVTATRGNDVFYVDPLDGTTNFAHGLPLFAVSIGLQRAGAPVLGVVHAPALGWTFAAAIEGASRTAHRNGTPIAVSQTTRVAEAMLLTGFPYQKTAPHKNLAEWAAFNGWAQGTRRMGSAALDLAFVACGWADAFWERHIKSWDLVAGAALVLAAGGQVTDLDRGPFVAETGQVLASNGLVHDEISATLAQVARDTGEPWP